MAEYTAKDPRKHAKELESLMIKPKVGRPRKYKTARQMQPILDDYFDNTSEYMYTVTGVALALGLDRKKLIEYGNRPEFSNTIKQAMTRVEYSYELALRLRGSAGDIFGLKNMGWSDRVEQDLTTHGDSVVIYRPSKLDEPTV